MIDSLPGRAQEVYDEGFEAGRLLGHSDGHEEGYDEGHRVGQQEGLEDGYNEGFEDGKGEGYDEGWKDREACNDVYDEVEAIIEDRINRLRILALDRNLTTDQVLDLLLAQVKLLG